MSKELTAGLFVLIGVLVTALFNSRTSSKAWLRQERLEAYRDFSAAVVKLSGDVNDANHWKEFRVAQEHIKVTASWGQTRYITLITDALELVTTFTYPPQGFHEDMDEFAGALFRETQAAIGVRIRIPLPTRVNAWLDSRPPLVRSAIISFGVMVPAWCLVFFSPEWVGWVSNLFSK